MEISGECQYAYNINFVCTVCVSVYVCVLTHTYTLAGHIF